MRWLWCSIASLVLILCGGCASSVGQGLGGERQLAIDSAMPLYSTPFVRLSADTIIDHGGSMNSFYKALQELQAAPRRGAWPSVVNIVHYGDSHLQGGYLSESLMRHLAADYGNAGIGTIVPHKLSGKNEPRYYSITSQGKSSASFIVSRNNSSAFGVSGVSIKTPAGTSYTLRTFDRKDGLDHRFSRVVVFHDSLAPLIGVQDCQVAIQGSGDQWVAPYNTVIELIEPTDSLVLTTSSAGKYCDGPIYGFSLENNSPGIRYHSIGVNSACYLHWGRYDDVARQSVALTPDLIIVSLGSNEAGGSNFVESVFLQQVDGFISKLRVANPMASILLTTPPEAMRRVKRVNVPNKNFEPISQALIRYGAENGVAVLDLYNATGGKGSAVDWKKSGLLFRDGIHYTAEGYELQAFLIYNAIVGRWK